MGNYYYDLPIEIQEMIKDELDKIYKKEHKDKFSGVLQIFNDAIPYEEDVEARLHMYDITEEEEKTFPWEWDVLFGEPEGLYENLTYHQFIIFCYNENMTEPHKWEYKHNLIMEEF